MLQIYIASADSEALLFVTDPQLVLLLCVCHNIFFFTELKIIAKGGCLPPTPPSIFREKSCQWLRIVFILLAQYLIASTETSQCYYIPNVISEEGPNLRCTIPGPCLLLIPCWMGLSQACCLSNPVLPEISMLRSLPLSSRSPPPTTAKRFTVSQHTSWG